MLSLLFTAVPETMMNTHVNKKTVLDQRRLMAPLRKSTVVHHPNKDRIVLAKRQSLIVLSTVEGMMKNVVVVDDGYDVCDSGLNEI